MKFFIFTMLLSVNAFSQGLSSPGQNPAGSALVNIKTLHGHLSNPIFQPYKTKAGGDSYGGGDEVDITKYMAWFYGNHPVTLCYQLTSNFGLPEAKVEADIVRAITTWQDYFNRKQIGTGIPPEEKINTNFHLKHRCEGGEDLVLYLGTGPIFGNLDDLAARQLYYQPSAYANKTRISLNLKWSRGYILFSEPEAYEYGQGIYYPRWNEGEAFYNMVLHEIGHILGFEHVDGTIMDNSVSRQNFVDVSGSQKAMSIDQTSELINCQSCPRNYKVTISKMKDLKAIEINGLKKINLIFSKGKTAAEVHEITYAKTLTPVLSFFSANSYQRGIPSVYHMTYKKQYYTLEVEGRRGVLRKNGKTVAQLQVEEN